MEKYTATNGYINFVTWGRILFICYLFTVKCIFITLHLFLFPFLTANVISLYIKYH